MISSRFTAAIAAMAVLLSGAPAPAQLAIDTLAGRQLGDGRLATAATLDRPFGVSFAPDGALLIADRGQSRIRRVDPVTGVIGTRAGSISGSRNNVQADQGEIQGPVTVHVDPANGSLIIADNIIRKGAVADPLNTDARVQGVRQFNALLAAEPRVTATAIRTVGLKGHDGFAIALVTSDP